MKKTIIILLLLSSFIYNCNNDDNNNDTNDPISQLPPATQTGANTFGCLLDGEVFLPGSGQNPLDCVYQFVNDGYYFALQANKRDSNNNLISIALGTNNLQIQQNTNFPLYENISGNAHGIYFFNTFLNYTSHTHRTIINHKT